MTDRIKPSELLAQLALPAQDLETLSFCASNKAATLQKWLDNLRATQVNQTAMQLYNAIPEIPRLKVPYTVRLEMLEIVRTRVQDSIEGLQKSFLNQPLIMPEEAQKAVLIAQTMQKSMIDAYIISISQITQLTKAKKNTMDDLARVICRAITGIGLLYFRCCQIYTQMPSQLWNTLHCLYQIADFYDVTVSPVEDATLKTVRTTTIEAAYARVLMLATAKTNQLSQNDVAIVYQIFERWSAHVKLRSPSEKTKANFLVVDPKSNQGPLSKTKIKDELAPHYLELDFSQLLTLFEKNRIGANHVSPTKVELIPSEFPSALLKHLHDTWTNEASRKNVRRNVSTEANICIGLVDCHFYCSNGIKFENFVQNDDRAHHQLPSGIPQGVTPDPQINNKDRPTFKAAVQNSSAGGYCLLWQGEIPNKVVAGELIGIKEVGKRTWDLGIIRWVRQLKGASQLGIQVLSHSPKPYGVAQTYGMGGHSDYMRGFFLPPERFGYGQETLIMGAVPFEEDDKVKIADGDQEWSAKLERQIFVTKSVQQFTFQTLEKINSMPTQANANSGGHISSWDDI